MVTKAITVGMQKHKQNTARYNGGHQQTNFFCVLYFFAASGSKRVGTATVGRKRWLTISYLDAKLRAEVLEPHAKSGADLWRCWRCPSEQSVGSSSGSNVGCLLEDDAKPRTAWQSTLTRYNLLGSPFYNVWSIHFGFLCCVVQAAAY